MLIAVILLSIAGLCIYKMFRPIFKVFFAVAMIMLILSVAVAAIKDGLGIDDKTRTAEQAYAFTEEDITLNDY